MPANEPALPVMHLTEDLSNARGGVRTISLPDKRTGSVFSAAALMNDHKLGAVARKFDTTLGTASTKLVSQNQNGYHGPALNSERQLFLTQTKPLLSELISQTRVARRDHKARLARTLQFDKDTQPGPELRSDYRRWLLENTVAERAVLLLKADYALAVSALEIGQAVIGLDKATWSKFEDHARALIFIKQAATESNHTLKPSLEFVTAAGLDFGAALADANAKIAQMYADGEILDVAESYIKSVIAFMAIIADTSPESLI